MFKILKLTLNTNKIRYNYLLLFINWKPNKVTLVNICCSRIPVHHDSTSVLKVRFHLNRFDKSINSCVPTNERNSKIKIKIKIVSKEEMFFSHYQGFLSRSQTLHLFFYIAFLNQISIFIVQFLYINLASIFFGGMNCGIFIFKCMNL